MTTTTAKVKHTPGPWATGTGIRPTDSKNLAIIADGLIIARTEHNISDVDEARANARLIAAAPDMLTELEHVHDMLRHYIKCGYLPHMSAEEAEQVVRNPDSAIRKARRE